MSPDTLQYLDGNDWVPFEQVAAPQPEQTQWSAADLEALERINQALRRVEA